MSKSPASAPNPASESGAPFAAAALFEHAQELFLLSGSEGVVVEINPAWTRQLGWSREALIGRSVRDFLHPEDMASVRAAAAEVEANGHALCAVRLKTEAGAWRWFEGSCRIGEGGLLAAVLRDVHAERELAAERARSSAQRAILIGKVGMTTWLLDSATRTFTRNRPTPWMADGERVSFAIDSMAETVHPDDLPGAVAKIERAMAEGVDGGYEVRVRGAGAQTWLTFQIDYHCEYRDGRWMVHGLSRDVTELVAARETARTAAAEAQALLEDAPFASCILNTDFEFISMSAAWRGMFSQFSTQIGGVFASEASPALRRRMHRVLNRALAGEVFTRSEDEVEMPEGRLIFRWQARPWRTLSGEIRGVIIHATDITDVVIARRNARANAKRLKLALAAADAAVFEVDYARKTFWAGPGFQKLAGRTFTYEEATGIWPTLHPDDREHIRQAYAAQDAHNPAPVEARLIGADGPRWARCQTAVRHDSQGRRSKLTGLVQDIHAQKLQAIALEEAERRANVAADAKSNFLANISHEIRTPMNGVLGVLQLIKREHLDAQEQALLDEALASGRMLTEMLDDLLDFSKIETGQFELHPEPLDPTAVLVGVASLLQPVASAKGLTMTAVAAPDLGLVKADPLRLRQALYNIMGNAVKFTPQGSIEARLARHTAEDGSERLRFEVQDTGIGVPEDFQATLFERFEQADGSASRKYGGSGLGLAITKRLAEMMGGAVGFTSVPGQGSTFWIEIDGAAVAPTEAAEAAEPEIGEFRVLLVEDNPTNRLVISKILEALGVTVDTAEDGAQGVELAAKGAYDLVLMDIQMPGMDGIEATKRIRAMDGPRGSTPILAVTANVLADQRTSYADAGMDGVVSKPVSAASLIAEITRVTERSAAA